MASNLTADHSLSKVYGFCSYPSCCIKNRRILKSEPFVEWGGITFTTEQVESQLTPIARLAASANPAEYVETFGDYAFNMELHPECAAEWGMHLIRDALNAKGEVGRKLRGTLKNAVQEQTQTV